MKIVFGVKGVNTIINKSIDRLLPMTNLIIWATINNGTYNKINARLIIKRHTIFRGEEWAIFSAIAPANSEAEK